MDSLPQSEHRPFSNFVFVFPQGRTSAVHINGSRNSQTQKGTQTPLKQKKLNVFFVSLPKNNWSTCNSLPKTLFLLAGYARCRRQPQERCGPDAAALCMLEPQGGSRGTLLDNTELWGHDKSNRHFRMHSSHFTRQGGQVRMHQPCFHCTDSDPIWRGGVMALHEKLYCIASRYFERSEKLGVVVDTARVRWQWWASG